MRFYFGDGRTVIAFSNVVVKIPRNIRGIEQCKAEIFIWKKYKHSRLCPILFNIGPVILMRRASFPGMVNVKKLENMFRLLTHEVKELLLEKGNPGDFRFKENWGILGDRYVMVDYGLTQKISDKYYPSKKK